MQPYTCKRIGATLAGSVLVLALCGAQPAHAAVEYVIHIVIDGVNSDMLQDLLENQNSSGDYDGFQRLIDEGASTYNARTDYTHTVTLPDHTSMLTGRPVLQPTGQPNTVHHGYTANGEPSPSTTLHNNQPFVSYVASTFDVVHDHGLKTALYGSKSKFVIWQQTYTGAGGPDLIPPDNGTNKIDFYKVVASRVFDSQLDDSKVMHDAFLLDMAAEHFNYTFLLYVDNDKSGHQYGWGSSEWDTTTAQVSRYLADVFKLVETDPVLMGRTAILVTTDHGGGVSDVMGHFCPTCPEHYTIPFYAWGPGVDAGSDFYALNTASRTDPGRGRPDYNAASQPIRNGDSGNLALSLLGLPPVPGSSSNAAQDLVVSAQPRRQQAGQQSTTE